VNLLVISFSHSPSLSLIEFFIRRNVVESCIDWIALESAKIVKTMFTYFLHE